MPRGLLAVLVALVVLALCALRPAGGQGAAAPWIIEPTAEADGAVAAGAAEVKRAQKLAKKKKFGEVVTVLEAVARTWPAAVHDCNLSLAYLRASALTRAQLMWDVARLRNADRPDWCTGELSGLLSTALSAAKFAPLKINVTPGDAVIEVGGIAMRGVDVVWLPPGTYVVLASAPDHVDHKAVVEVALPSAKLTIKMAVPEVEVDAGVVMPGVVIDAAPVMLSPDAAPVAIEPPPPPPVVAAPVRWPGWVGLGVGVIALTGGGVFHARAIDARDDGNAVPRDSAAFDAALARFETARTRTLAGYVIGLVAAGFGTWWLLDHRAAPAIAIEAGGDGGAVTFGGAW